MEFDKFVLSEFGTTKKQQMSCTFYGLVNFSKSSPHDSTYNYCTASTSGQVSMNDRKHVIKI
jgi:hypothetical protein